MSEPSQQPAAQKPRAESGDNQVIWSVSEIAAAVRRRLESGFAAPLRVRGELGRVSQPGSGHLYMDIKDADAVLAGVMWRAAAARLRLRPAAGMEVICTGRLASYAAQSRYQLIIEHMELAGKGALMAMLDARRLQLAQEGLFAEERKKPLPFLPQCIGVITSPSGAVLRDIVQRVGARFARRIVVWPVRVQGETCAAEVARAIKGFNAKQGAERPDVLIVARGGGSLEDLWGFNEEEPVRAAAASTIPLVSAIGHETDYVLLDYAADERAATPSAAAERVVPVREELLHRTESLALRLRRGGLRLLAHKRTALAACARALGQPRERLNMRAQRLDDAGARLAQALKQHWQALGMRLEAASRAPLGLIQLRLREADAQFRQIARLLRRALAHGWQLRQQRLREAQRALSLLSHESVLQRGFALVLAPGDRLVRRTEDAPRGTRLRLQLAGNQALAARSEGAHVTSGREKNGGARAKSVNSARRKKNLRQNDLFA